MKKKYRWNLKIKLSQCGMTQWDLAKKCDMHQSKISYILNADIDPIEEDKKKIAAALGETDIEKLFEVS